METFCTGRNPITLEVFHGYGRVAAAVAGAATRSGAASRPVTDLTAYSEAVATRVRRSLVERAHCAPAEPAACRRRA